MTRIRVTAIGLFLLISCNAWADLKTYDVDFQYRQEVYEALRGVLLDNSGALSNSATASRYGRVQLLPSGQILVDAAPETLVQVEAVIRAVRERPAGAAPRVSLRYWAVLGTRAGGNAADAPSTMQVPSVLGDVLAELERFHGELAFRVIGSAAVVTESGQPGEVDGMPFSVEQEAYVQGQTLNANIAMRLESTDPTNFFEGELEVRATLQRGEFVVLGESTLRSTQQGGGLDGTLFYIVHWPEGE
jgi:hypothetical protein